MKSTAINVEQKEVENIKLTRVMKDYSSLKQSAKRYLLMTLIISLAAIIIGVGIMSLSGGTFHSGNKDDKKDNKKDDSGNKDSLTGKNKVILFKENIKQII